MKVAVSWLEWHEEPVLSRVIPCARALGVNDACSWLKSGFRLNSCKCKVIMNFADTVVQCCTDRTAGDLKADEALGKSNKSG